MQNDPMQTSWHAMGAMAQSFLHHSKFVSWTLHGRDVKRFIAATANEETSMLACNFVIVCFRAIRFTTQALDGEGHVECIAQGSA
jgi:hypothetical protein